MAAAFGAWAEASGLAFVYVTEEELAANPADGDVRNKDCSAKLLAQLPRYS